MVAVQVAPGAESSTGRDQVPLEVLERNLTSHAAHLAAAEAQWLDWLGEYCVREGWGEWGCSGPAQWLSWQCGMSPPTAREKVRVALALRELPVIRARFGKGRLSYSKVRALTRVATAKTDHELATLAIAATGAQLELIVRSYKTAQDADKGARSAWSQRSWRARSHEDETSVFTLRLQSDQADMAQAAIVAEVNHTIDDALLIRTDESRADLIEQRGGWAAMCADAALALLIGTSRTGGTEPTEVEMVVTEGDDDRAGFGQDGSDTLDTDNNDSMPAQDGDEPGVSAEAVEYQRAGRSLAPATGQRLCCDPRIAALIEDSRGTVLGVGRKTRVVGRKLRRALERRDQRQCQFAGCGAQRRLHAHHIVHWTNGGPTELHNLILLCNFHHHAVHEGGWNIDPTTRSTIKPNGTIADPTPSARFRGSAVAVTQVVTLPGPAPLAEAENEPFDLGLVLESLAFVAGPPIPRDIERERILAAHRKRSPAG